MARSSVLEQVRTALSWVFANPHYKFLSLLLAIGTWLWVQGEEVIQGQARVTLFPTRSTGDSEGTRAQAWN